MRTPFSTGGYAWSAQVGHCLPSSALGGSRLRAAGQRKPEEHPGITKGGPPWSRKFSLGRPIVPPYGYT